MFGADFGDHLSRLDGRSGRCVKFAVMMEFDDLDIRKIFGCLFCHEHHENGTDRKIRRDKCRRALFLGFLADLVFLILAEACRTDDRRNVMLQCRDNIAENNIRTREVKHDFRFDALENGCEIRFDADPVCRQADETARVSSAFDVNGTDEFEFRIILNCL